MRRAGSILLGLALSLDTATAGAADGPSAKVGAASIDITPTTPIRMTGYESRKTESEGVEQPLKARALALGDDATGPAVVIAVDNCGVPATIVEELAARLKRKADLPRERLVVGSTHTHSGPALAGALPIILGESLPDDQRDRIERYTRELVDKLEQVALEALADRKAGSLAWGKGQVGFAANRRVLKQTRWSGFGVNPDGPVDRTLPVLRANDASGKLRAVLFGYACHCTTLGGNFNKVCGDWAGYACEAIERAHPGAVALYVPGCGADANPFPREGDGLRHAKAHGQAAAREVERLLASDPTPLTDMTPLPGAVAARLETIALPFGPIPDREQWAERAKKPGAEGYHARIQLGRLDRGEALPASIPYPVQTWCFGDELAMVFLPGEVVVDYALRLKRERDGARLWVSAYCNAMPCYVASRRMLAEGGYEVDSSMIYYDRPTRLAPEAEDRIIEAVHRLLPKAFNAPGAALR